MREKSAGEEDIYNAGLSSPAWVRRRIYVIDIVAFFLYYQRTKRERVHLFIDQIARVWTPFDLLVHTNRTRQRGVHTDGNF